MRRERAVAPPYDVLEDPNGTLMRGARRRWECAQGALLARDEAMKKFSREARGGQKPRVHDDRPTPTGPGTSRTFLPMSVRYGPHLQLPVGSRPGPPLSS